MVCYNLSIILQNGMCNNSSSFLLVTHCYLLHPEPSPGYILIQLIIILTRKDFPRWKWIIMPPFSSLNGRFPEIKITTGFEHSPPHHISWLSTPSLPPCWPVHVLPHTDIHMHKAFSVHSRPAGDLSYIQYGDLVWHILSVANQWLNQVMEKVFKYTTFWKLFSGVVSSQGSVQNILSYTQ